MKTQAMRILEGKRIRYELLAYPDDEKDAEIIANILDLSPADVFKTLVVIRGHSKPLLVMIPANKKVDLKKVARTVGEKKVKMASHQEAESLTGLQVGGISALGLINKGFLLFLDRRGVEKKKIYISAGKRGYQIGLDPQDLLAVTNTKVIDAVATK